MTSRLNLAHFLTGNASVLASVGCRKESLLEKIQAITNVSNSDFHKT